MDLPHLTDKEKACVHSLAKMKLNGVQSLCGALTDFQKYGFEIDANELPAILATMESIGVVERIVVGDVIRLAITTISPAAITISRFLEQSDADGGDIVAQLQKSARGNKILAFVIIGFIVLTAIVTFANQTAQLLERFGVVATTPK